MNRQTRLALSKNPLESGQPGVGNLTQAARRRLEILNNRQGVGFEKRAIQRRLRNRSNR